MEGGWGTAPAAHARGSGHSALADCVRHKTLYFRPYCFYHQRRYGKCQVAGRAGKPIFRPHCVYRHCRYEEGQVAHVLFSVGVAPGSPECAAVLARLNARGFSAADISGIELAQVCGAAAVAVFPSASGGYGVNFTGRPAHSWGRTEQGAPSPCSFAAACLLTARTAVSSVSQPTVLQQHGLCRACVVPAHGDVGPSLPLPT